MLEGHKATETLSGEQIKLMKLRTGGGMRWAREWGRKKKTKKKKLEETRSFMTNICPVVGGLSYVEQNLIIF